MKLLALLALLSSSFSWPPIGKVENEKVISYFDLRDRIGADFMLESGYYSASRSDIEYGHNTIFTYHGDWHVNNAQEVFHALKERYELQKKENFDNEISGEVE